MITLPLLLLRWIEFDLGKFGEGEPNLVEGVFELVALNLVECRIFGLGLVASFVELLEGKAFGGEFRASWSWRSCWLEHLKTHGRDYE